MEDVNKRRRISFLSPKLSALLRKLTPGKFAFLSHSQQIGINPTKIEKTGIHFKTDLFTAVAVVDFKALYFFVSRDEQIIGGSCVGAARKVSPNWSLETMTCHSFHCFSIVWGQG